MATTYKLTPTIGLVGGMNVRPSTGPYASAARSVQLASPIAAVPNCGVGWKAAVGPFNRVRSWRSPDQGEGCRLR
jgi:hypothetical protein